jgi:hypothetical protein
MPTPTGRYARPSIEIEFFQDNLAKECCCRFVPIVLRLCGVPAEQSVMLTVSFERTRKYAADGTALDDYDVHPGVHDTMQMRRKKQFPGYHEYAVDLLARAHREETGTIRIKMESWAHSVLSEAVYVLDSRHDSPVEFSCQKGSFQAVRMVPYVRSEEERDSLKGQFPAAVGGISGPEQSSLPHATWEMCSLFTQEG